ncbi:MAG TPA: translational GTPase TypA [Myxococcota bacterium]|nr:translational GTPase TypA [Myxococcota bacterium]
MGEKQKNIRNVAIIAHVDHGKTTMIDNLFQQAGLFKSHQQMSERVMDSGELEKERGITITAKNASFFWKGVQINIIDTPGHADFGGEVERALFMADGAFLLVDAAEGPLPQTRFVLRKAFEQGLHVAVVINKVDRPDARIDEVEEQIMELFFDLAVDEKQTQYTTIYASAKEGWASNVKGVRKENLHDLLDLIVNEFPPPRLKKDDGKFRMLVANLSYSSFVGQVAIGRIESGSVKLGQRVVLIDANNKRTPFTISSLESFSGLSTKKCDELSAGDIALIAGINNPEIGDTIAQEDIVEPLPRISVDPPSVAVKVSVNTSPLAGQEGEYLTSRKLEEVLKKACLTNVALDLEPTQNPEVFLLKGRGELQIVILLEELRRRGYELMVGRPEVIPHQKDGAMFEAEDQMVIDVPDNFVGTVTELLSERGGRMEAMTALEGSQRVRMEFAIPARGLIALRSTLLTRTKGEAIYSSSFKRWIPFLGQRLSRANGALVSDRSGAATEYALHNLQDRGKLFVGAGAKVYEGMVFGENNRVNDLTADPTREKKLTNIRAAGKDESTKLSGIYPFDLDSAIEWIDDDEWVEVTPKNIRVRKDELRTNMRKVVRNIS